MEEASWPKAGGLRLDDQQPSDQQARIEVRGEVWEKSESVRLQAIRSFNNAIPAWGTQMSGCQNSQFQYRNSKQRAAIDLKLKIGRRFN
jgi:hypothetical protein